MILLLGAGASFGCLGDRERPGPPRLSFTIDDTTVSTSKADTVSGVVRADDSEGLDSVWVTVDSVQKGDDAGLQRSFSSGYRFVVPAGRALGNHIPMSFRARDIAGFLAQRDTYVVVVP